MASVIFCMGGKAPQPWSRRLNDEVQAWPRVTFPTMLSSRHGFPYTSVPSVRGQALRQPAEYGAILDCVYEMADAISNGNGIPADQAVDQVCRDEGWRLLPIHKQLIVQRLKD